MLIKPRKLYDLHLIRVMDKLRHEQWLGLPVPLKRLDLHHNLFAVDPCCLALQVTAGKIPVASSKYPKGDKFITVRRLLQSLCMEPLSSKTKDYFDKQMVSANISLWESFLDAASLLYKAH